MRSSLTSNTMSDMFTLYCVDTEAIMLPDDSVFSRNDTLKTISNRHSVRSFTSDDVNDEEIKVLLHAANAAPSAHNQQAWRFIILRGGKKQELAQLVTTQSTA